VQEVGADASTTCAAESQSAKSVPVDLYIMMDQSASMILPAGSGTRWSSITDALQTFVTRPEAEGVGVGIQYFGLGISCDAADYALPEVEIAPLPDNAQAISDSIASHLPIAVTPTGPALEGAIDHASQWQMAHPDHVVAVVLATDGEPDTCGSTTDSVAQTAADGLAAMPSIRSFVIGVGSGLTALDQVAQSGGTDQAFIVDDGQDTTQQLIDALDKIRMRATLPCEYALPAPTGATAVDFDKVNVTSTPSTGAQAGQPGVILRAPDPSACDAQSGGWYYDDPKAPKSIKLCDASCAAVSEDTGAKLDILLGCQSQVIMVQ
jgi:von Willebrand factor type A domain